MEKGETLLLEKKKKREFFVWFKLTLIALVISGVVISILQPVTVSGHSMQPTLEDGEFLIVNKIIYNYQNPDRGDVIIFDSGIIDVENNKEKVFVKRVIAVGGDHLVIKDNNVYINNDMLDETYLNNVGTEGDIDIIIPKDSIFVMGDNREKSVDSRSRSVGLIKLSKVIGKASVRVFPFDRIGNIY